MVAQMVVRKGAAVLVPLTAEQRQVVERFHSYAMGLSLRYHRSGRSAMSVEDLQSEAVMGLIHAVQSFRPELGIDLRVYAAIVIRRRLSELVKRAARRPRSFPLFDDATTDRSASIPGFRDRDGSVSSAVSAADTCERLRSQLPPDWYALLMACFGNGHRQVEVAISRGVTRQAIEQMLRRAAARARELAPDWGEAV